MLAREDGKEIEDVEKQILVRARHRGDQTLVRRDHLVLIIRLFRYIGEISTQALCRLNREIRHTYCVAELVVHVVGYHRFLQDVSQTACMEGVRCQYVQASE